jgi:hypothetical protein
MEAGVGFAMPGPLKACVIPGLGIYSIIHFAMTSTGAYHLYSLWHDSQGRPQKADFTDRTGVSRIIGAFPYVDTTRNTEILLWNGEVDASVPSGEIPNRLSVGDYYFTRSTGELGWENLSGTAWAPRPKGAPVGYYNRAADMNHVIYPTGNGHLHELYWRGVERVTYGGDLIAKASAPSAVLGPASGFVNAHNDNIVVFMGTDGHVRSLYWKEGSNNNVDDDDLSGVAGMPLGTGSPSAYYTVHNDTHQVVYRSAGNGHLYELFWRGYEPVQGWPLTERAGALQPAAGSSLSTYYHAGTNTKHVVYVDYGGHMHDIFWAAGTGPRDLDLTNAFHLPHAEGPSVAFTVEGQNTQHYVFLHPHQPGQLHVLELVR